MNSTISKSGADGVAKIAVTMGDPAGIGPEVCIKLLQQPQIFESAIPVIIGDADVLRFYADRLASGKLPDIVSLEKLDPNTTFDRPTIVDVGHFEFKQQRLGQVDADCGAASFQYIQAAIDFNLRGWLDAVVTGPINKLSLQAAGFDYPGHTEIFAEKTSTPNFCMMQYSQPIVCSFVTTHIGYTKVGEEVNSERILDVIKLTDSALQKLQQKRPNLICCGLNPHAGENGLFGNREEELILQPAIVAARELGIAISNPLPPDTCFIPKMREQADGYICMYHDQGHIPLKALAFDEAVNITLGLPIIRTSVDHGTAFDIVNTNQANPSSLIAAFQLASRLAKKTVVGHPG